MDKSSTNQAMMILEAQPIAMKSYIKCDKKTKSLYECFNDVKETEKPNEVLQKILLFCKM